MKKQNIIALLVAFSPFFSSAQSLYWDANGADAGAGFSPFGTWDTDAFWSSSADGNVATSSWIDGREAVFSAGNDATSGFSVNVNGNVNASGIIVEEGDITLSGGTISLITPASISVATGLSLDVNSVVAGSAGLTKTGPGILRLNTANTFAGTVRIGGGILSVPNDDRMGVVPSTAISDAIIMDGGVLQWTATENLSLHANRGIVLNTTGTFDQPVLGPPATMRINGIISGPHAIAKTGIGVMALAGANTFTGGIDLYEGRLNPVGDGCFGTGPLRVRSTVTPVVAIGGSVSVTNAIILDAGSTLHLPTGSPLTLGGPISGEGGLLRDGTGSGTTTLAGANTFTGGVAIHARTIALAHRQALGAGVLTIGDPFFGPGTAINLLASSDLGGANALANPVVVNQNFTLSGAFNMEFSGDVTLVSTRTITVNDANAPKTFSGIISGEFGGITKAGPATLILTGSNVYTGDTTVNAGTLQINNTTGSGTGSGNVTVGSGGTLGGNGIIAGAVTVNGAISPGISAGKLTLQNGLTFSGNSRCIWEPGALKDNSNGTAGVDFDQILVTAGEFATSGGQILMVRFPDPAVAPVRTELFWQQPHTWTVISLSGTASNPANSGFDVVDAPFNDAGVFTTSVAAGGNILLHFTPTDPPAPPPTVFYWDANGTNAGAINPDTFTAAGIWGVDTFWSASSEGDTNTVAWQEGTKAVFAAGTDTVGLPYTVTVNGTREVSAITVEEGTLTISSGSLSLTSTNGESEMSIAADLLTTVGSIIAGTNSVVKTGDGILRFNGINSYFGRTIIKAGTLRAQQDNRLGTAPSTPVSDAVTLDGGTLEWVATGGQPVNVNRGFTITTNNGTINESAGGTITVNGIVTGPGMLTKTGSGILVLPNVNTYEGGTDVLEGEFRVDSMIGGAGTGVIRLADGVTLRSRLGVSTADPMRPETTLVLTNDIVLIGPGSATFGPGGGGSQVHVDYAGIISGAGGIIRQNVGDKIMVLSGANRFSGGVQLLQRPLALGNKSALGTGIFSIGDPFAPPANQIRLEATLDLMGANAITNPVIIYQQFSLSSPIELPYGLEFRGPIELGNPDIPIFCNTAGTTMPNLTNRFSGVVSSANGYGFIKEGAGTLVLSGANTYAGGTTIAAGTLAVNNTNGSGTGSGSVIVNGPATLGGSGTIAGSVTSIGGAISPGPATNAIGNLTLQNGLDLTSGGTAFWELGALKDDGSGVAGTDFDKISVTGGTLALGASAELSLNFIGNATAPDSSNPFWQTAHQWTVIGVNGSAISTGENFATLLNSDNSAGVFSTTVEANGSVVLHFTPNTTGPSFSSITADQNGVTFSWQSEIGVDYDVEYKTDLNDAQWIPLSSHAGTGNVISVTHDFENDPQRFYRLVIAQ